MIKSALTYKDHLQVTSLDNDNDNDNDSDSDSDNDSDNDNGGSNDNVNQDGGVTLISKKTRPPIEKK
nr:unnamed protein product [Callosobruchus chinensis]